MLTCLGPLGNGPFGKDKAMDIEATFEALKDMQTTAEIADAFDKVLTTIGNVDGSKELVAAVLVAMMLSGKGHIQAKDA